MLIHSSIAIKSMSVPGLKLWYILRAMDEKGEGRVITTLKELIAKGFSRATLYRYLKNNSLFRAYKSNKGRLTVYLVGLLKVCKALNITSLGACGYGVMEESLIDQAIAIQAQSLQAQSFFLAQLNNKITSTDPSRSYLFKPKDKDGLQVRCRYNPHAARYNIVNPPECFFDTEGKPHLTSVITSGVNQMGYLPVSFAHTYNVPAGICETSLSNSSDSTTFMEFNSYVLPYGASQKGIASRLDVSIPTVAKALKNHSKVRTSYRTTFFHFNKARFEASEDLLGKPLESGFYLRNVNGQTQVFKAGTYIYYPLYQLSNKRYLRNKLNFLNSYTRSSL